MSLSIGMLVECALLENATERSNPNSVNDTTPRSDAILRTTETGSGGLIFLGDRMFSCFGDSEFRLYAPLRCSDIRDIQFNDLKPR